MAKDFDWMEDSNRSGNPSIHEVSDPARRVLLLGGIGALTIGAPAPWRSARPTAGRSGPESASAAVAGTADRGWGALIPERPIAPGGRQLSIPGSGSGASKGPGFAEGVFGFRSRSRSVTEVDEHK